MLRVHRVNTVLLGILAVAILGPGVATAQGAADRDAREVSSYVLTEAGLAKYRNATASLGELSKQVAHNCADDDDGDDGSASLDETVARINAIPGAQAAIQSAGMTTREYVVFTWSLFQNGMAAWAVSQPGGKLPPGVSKANVDFYRAHEASLRDLGSQAASESCEEAAELEEEATE